MGAPARAHARDPRTHGCEVARPIAAARRVRQHPEFEADFVSQLEWLFEHGDREWVLNLFDGTMELVETLRRFPAAGEIKDQRRGITLRQLRHPRGPYLVWYVLDERRSHMDIWVVRLFHIRQLRPPPDVGHWIDVAE